MNENNSYTSGCSFYAAQHGTGCFPECVVVDTDDKGVFQNTIGKITTQNKNNYKHLFDKTDDSFSPICTKLEKRVDCFQK